MEVVVLAWGPLECEFWAAVCRRAVETELERVASKRLFPTRNTDPSSSMKYTIYLIVLWEQMWALESPLEDV